MLLSSFLGNHLLTLEALESCFQTYSQKRLVFLANHQVFLQWAVTKSPCQPFNQYNHKPLKIQIEKLRSHKATTLVEMLEQKIKTHISTKINKSIKTTKKTKKESIK
jgi:hypothetical protein